MLLRLGLGPCARLVALRSPVRAARLAPPRGPTRSCRAAGPSVLLHRQHLRLAVSLSSRPSDEAAGDGEPGESPRATAEGKGKGKGTGKGKGKGPGTATTTVRRYAVVCVLSIVSLDGDRGPLDAGLR